MNKWNASNVPSQKGKIAIITGANSGIGYETALALAEKEATVVLACRDMLAAEKAKSNILQKYPNASLQIMKIDLSSLEEVRKFVSNFRSRFDRLDILINNAGIMMSPYKVTDDGFENQLATNYIGHFALTNLLLPLLTSTSKSRVITLSSLSYKWESINFDDLHFEEKYDKKKAYGQSKRACLVFAYELNRRLSNTEFNTISLAAHPGLSNTNLDRYFPALIRPLGNLFLQNPKKGALSVLYATLEENLKGGEYIGPNGFQELRGHPTVVDSDDKSKDKEIGKQLWKETEKMTHTHFDFANAEK